MRKKIFYKITGFFLILFFVTLCCAIVYLDFDHKRHSLENSKTLAGFISNYIEKMYEKNDVADLQRTINNIVLNHKELCGIYIEKNGKIELKSKIDVKNDDFDKMKNKFNNSDSNKENLNEFLASDGIHYYDINYHIGDTSATLHIIISEEWIVKRTLNEFYVVFGISLIALLIGLFLANKISLKITKELNLKNHRLIISEKQWKLLFDSSPMGIVILDRFGIITQCNNSINKIFNFEPHKIIGKHILENIESNAEKSFRDNLLDVSQLSFTESEISLEMKNGNIKYILRSPIPIISNDSSLNGVMIYYFDITERKRREEEINIYSSKLKGLVELRTAELQATNKLLSTKIEEKELIENNLKKINADKDKLFSIIAHDLRSPFNALLGASSFLDSEIDSLTMDEIKLLSSNLNRSAHNVFKLLENLLAWARLQTGQISFVPIALNLKEIAMEIHNLYQYSAANKKVELINNINDDIIVFADENMVKAVFRNLISNAIKFSRQHDKVNINFELKNEIVVISIVDTGVGMSQNAVNKLFDIGSNFSTIGTEGEKGTGLGLILTKEFVEKNNGSLIVQSKLGEGSSFSFSLQLYKFT